MYQRNLYQLFPYHIIESSPWPITMAFSLLWIALSFTLTIHSYINNNIILILSGILLIFNMTLWFRDIIAEALYQGHHTIIVRKSLNNIFFLFIISEILIFIGIFWAYFHSALNPSIELGNIWPSFGLSSISPLELPLLNTILLLASGVTITISHYAAISGNKNLALASLSFTTLLIILFVVCQYFEYSNAHFTITDGVYGSVFFTGTGLHFFHMNMLIVMLVVCLIRFISNQFTTDHHVNFETTILYLHVLDIIWLFLYVIMYWWK